MGTICCTSSAIREPLTVLQRTLKPGMQCITKTDNNNPKSEELAYQKGDLVTIISTCQNRGWFCACHHSTGLEGLIPASALRERPAIKVDSRLSLMPWFHGSISGVQAVQQLQTREEGLFLVRESIRHPGDYVLCVSHHGDVVHYRIHHHESNLSIDLEQKFSNLMDMIEFYTINQGALCTKLMKPKPKQGTKSAEEELSKAGWLLSFQRLTLGKKIGQGEFGDVLEGEYMGQPVAIKNIRCDITANSFLTETATMTKLKHKNLVNLLGVVLHNGLYIVMEFMSKGNLVNYLRSKGRVLVPQQQLIFFSLDVAEGMEYLEEKRLVHRDLAARNILISEQRMAKVSDFGLSQSKLLKKDQSNRLPIKWTAPEALLHNKFSSRSDVWSYGILLWEVYSYGRGPYPRLAVKEVYEKVCNGYRLEAPENCPQIIYSLMRSCWEDDPGKRPSFKKLKEKLGKLIPGDQ